MSVRFLAPVTVLASFLTVSGATAQTTLAPAGDVDNATGAFAGPAPRGEARWHDNRGRCPEDHTGLQ